ncbi:MAG: RHS repeat protein [Deltaproteobacteria bacterium]|nr:RHS repeat protein [Deltaproteobacteria bacterium]
MTHLDHLGRAVRVVAHNRRVGGGDQFQLTRTVLDVQGNALQVVDARGNVAESRVYGMLGQALQIASHDTGTRRAISNVLGVALRAFDDRGQAFRTDFDALWRPTHSYVEAGGGPAQLITRIVYGESAPSPEVDNLRGQVLVVYDSAGSMRNVAFDFRGALVRSERRLAIDYTTTPDWSVLVGLTDPIDLEVATAPLLEAEVFVTESSWDALGRPVTQTFADGTVTRLGYNDGGRLDTVDADVRGALPSTGFVTGIDYDVRGRRASVSYGNGSTTTYTYDPVTYRLTRLHTARASDGAAVQDLRYVYDPVGNIVEVDDLAQQTVFFANAQISARQRFEYDATYQLAVAEGREHTSSGSRSRPSSPRARCPMPVILPRCGRGWRPIYTMESGTSPTFNTPRRAEVGPARTNTTRPGTGCWRPRPQATLRPAPWATRTRMMLMAT